MTKELIGEINRFIDLLINEIQMHNCEYHYISNISGLHDKWKELDAKLQANAQ